MVRRQHALPLPHHKRYLLSIQPPEPDLAARLLTSFRFLLGFARHSYSLPAFHSSLSLNFWAGWVFSQTRQQGDVFALFQILLEEICSFLQKLPACRSSDSMALLRINHHVEQLAGTLERVRHLHGVLE